MEEQEEEKVAQLGFEVNEKKEEVVSGGQGKKGGRKRKGN